MHSNTDRLVTTLLYAILEKVVENRDTIDKKRIHLFVCRLASFLYRQWVIKWRGNDGAVIMSIHAGGKVYRLVRQWASNVVPCQKNQVSGLIVSAYPVVGLMKSIRNSQLLLCWTGWLGSFHSWICGAERSNHSKGLKKSPLSSLLWYIIADRLLLSQS